MCAPTSAGDYPLRKYETFGSRHARAPVGLSRAVPDQPIAGQVRVAKPPVPSGFARSAGDSMQAPPRLDGSTYVLQPLHTAVVCKRNTIMTTRKPSQTAQAATPTTSGHSGCGGESPAGISESSCLGFGSFIRFPFCPGEHQASGLTALAEQSAAPFYSTARILPTNTWVSVS